MDQSAIDRFFIQTPMLASLCTQNGWPDSDSLKIDVLDQTASTVVCAVSFDEILMEGAGCVAGRVPCWGRFRLDVDSTGRVVHAERDA